MRVQRVVAVLAALTAIAAATAAGAEGPQPWQMDFRPAASPVMEEIREFNTLLGIIIIGTGLFVMGLMGWVIIRYNAKANPVPSTTTHNLVVEVIWTVVPILILVVIAIPSFRLLYFQDRVEDAEMTLKATGNQWYWTYEYPDYSLPGSPGEPLTFDAFMVEDDQLEAGQLRLLETDNHVVLPVDTDIRILVTAPPEGVIHAWAVPSFGIKVDAVPGRLNETWVRITEPGTYYGMCSELCGVLHGFMPITVDAVSRAEFDAWMEAQLEAWAGLGNEETIRLASDGATANGEAR